MRNFFFSIATISLGLAVAWLLGNGIAEINIKKFTSYEITDPRYDQELKRYFKREIHDYVHPFYGLSSGSEIGFESEISEENNFNTISPRPANGEIRILVLGGSVAANLSMARVDINDPYMFANALNERFNTNAFVVYNAAFGGGKQPQQYFKFLYLDLLGFHPDLVINLDGFNEVALPFAENLPKELNAVYPRSFSEAVHATAASTECIRPNNKLLAMKTEIAIFELIKWTYIQKCHVKLTGGLKLWKFANPQRFEKEVESYSDRVKNIWLESSNKLHDALRVRGLKYIHIIQPKQYLPNSKPLSPLEARDFVNLPFFQEPIEKHYHDLPVNKLNTTNVIDLRYLFASESKTVYSDACCHFNELGMSKIVESVISEGESVFSQLLEARLEVNGKVSER